MGLFVDDLSLSEIVTHMLYKTALAIAIMRWVVSWVLRLRNRNNNSTTSNLLESENLPFPSSPSSSPSTQLIRDSLVLTTFGDITERLRNDNDTCAVCLNRLRTNDEVRELRNCCHVFHRECLDRWLDHDHHKTCPLCRAPFLTPSQSQSLSLAAARSQPSWAVERLLYLFGDDLLL
ncbi:RING-H2 zinc finger protein RHA1a [Morus notabilis]|uniref:RING-H2 zinc finger protein RHA1a n=1 Tax=Morus notabilis TaxID=981085 RepID=W9S3X4_9ROSA|nr:E3 ubiquitin-protein ligase ATL4 [Morus notabilis]EXC13620.1 RING-H2 zinc finger protein RHA1a [Morus notabilis]